MKLLLINNDIINIEDIKDVLAQNNIFFSVLNHCFGNYENEELFVRIITSHIKETTYNAIFSINYIPFVANFCYAQNIKYLAWSYDALSYLDIAPTLNLSTNFLFLFDRAEFTFFKSKGFDNVYHLPLAINSKRLSKFRLQIKEEIFSHDVSFVGSLYPSSIDKLLPLLSKYNYGYLSGLMDIQMKIYGKNIIKELLSNSLVSSICAQVPSLIQPDFFARDRISIEMAKSITQKERLLILSLLSKHHQVSLYSNQVLESLPSIKCCGTVSYYNEMPKVFFGSKVNLNITFKRIETGIPLRALDILGSGGLLLTNYQEEIFEHFINGHDCLMYESIEDSLAKTSFLLNHEDIRQQIAYNGYCKVHELFSYEKQFAILFKTAGLID